MLGHEFEDMPGKKVEIGFDPHETVLMLRCKWCRKTPSKAREDGCPINEVSQTGHILLSDFNPDGMERFNGRNCLTCERPIMSHWLRRDSRDYYCYLDADQVSQGIDNAKWDVPEGLGSNPDRV